METDIKAEWLDKLQSSGYRLTTPLRIIVEILAQSPRALEPVEIYDLGRKIYPSLGLVTIYRTLDKLERLGMVQRLHQSDGCQMYLRAAQGHEHILLCTGCGLVKTFRGDDLTALISATVWKADFKFTITGCSWSVFARIARIAQNELTS